MASQKLAIPNPMLQDASSWNHVMDHHVALPDRQASGSGDGFAALPISAMLFFFLNYFCLHRASGRCGSEFQKLDGPRLIDAGLLLLLSSTYNREYMTADDQPLPRQQQPTKPSNFGAYGSVGLSAIGNDASRVCRARHV